LDTQGTSEARERVLVAAERLFSERGYAAVTMKDVAAALGMRQASLYHHVPAGKEHLFIEVTQRGFARHSTGLRQALEAAQPVLREQLRAAAHWLLAQPPLDLTRLFRSDLPAISMGNAEQLLQVVVDALFEPIKLVLQQAYERGETRAGDHKAIAISFLAIIEAVHDIQRYTPTPKEVLANDMIDVLLDGLRRR
jgi:TetR/AcrR family transcriptional regulator, cholesterol catabolism regulator